MMNEFNFTCLPSQLVAWLKQYHQLPAEMEIDNYRAEELIFTALFPNIRNYHHARFTTGVVGASVEYSVHIVPRYPRASDGKVEVWVVYITDTANGIKSALAIIESAGLFKGEELIKEAVKEACIANKAQVKRQELSALLGGLFIGGGFLTAVVTLFVFFFRSLGN